MTKEERESVRQNAAENHGGNLEAAAADFIDAALEYKRAKGIPAGFEAGIGGIVWEVENSDDSQAAASAETTEKANLSRMNKPELLDLAATVGAGGVGLDSTKKQIIAAIEAAG